jgi:hypothetical protein
MPVRPKGPPALGTLHPSAAGRPISEEVTEEARRLYTALKTIAPMREWTSV